MPEETASASENGRQTRLNAGHLEAATTAMRAAASIMTERRDLARRAGLQHGGDRDLYETYGWDRDLDFDDYLEKYQRQGPARAIIAAPAQATWRHAPTIVDDGSDPDEEDTRFEREWSDLVDAFRIYHYLERVDRLAGIYQYAGLFIGTTGSVPLNEEMPTDAELAYLTPYRQDHLEIVEWEEDPRDPRFGQPTMYELTLVDDEDVDDTGFNPEQRSIRVHWTRVLHVAEDLDEDEVFGTPRLQPVMNLLDDFLKVRGGSAEMFFQDAAAIYHANVEGDADLPEEGEPGSFQDMEDQFIQALDGFRRFIGTKGTDFDIKRGESPRPQQVWDMLKEALAAGARMPLRIIFGSERGELASSEDQGEWLARISERQTRFAYPLVLRRLIDRFINHGMLSEPAGGSYTIEPPNLFELDEVQEAEVRKTDAQALQALSGAMAAGGISRDAPIWARLGFDDITPSDLDDFMEEEDDASRQDLEAVDGGAAA